jgi:ubiquinol-cytochrome c reductase iron-sulfur subunit
MFDEAMTDFSSPRSRLNRPPIYQGDADPTSPQPARVAGRAVPTSDHPDRNPASRDVDQRLGDFAPQAGQRATREVAGALAVAAVFVVASVVFYIGFADTADSSGAGLGNLQVSNLVLGLTIGVALLLAGVGLVRWSRVLMAGNPIVEHTAAGGLPQNGFGEDLAGRKLGRRPLILNAALGALALLPLPAVLALRGFDPDASTRRAQTAWVEGVRLLTDQSYRPIRVSDLQVGEMVNVMPAACSTCPSRDRRE